MASSQAVRIAREFHATYERLAPEFGYRTRQASARAWEDIPPSNRSLMVATAQDLLDRDIIAALSNSTTTP